MTLLKIKNRSADSHKNSVCYHVHIISIIIKKMRPLFVKIRKQHRFDGYILPIKILKMHPFFVKKSDLI